MFRAPGVGAARVRLFRCWLPRLSDMPRVSIVVPFFG